VLYESVVAFVEQIQVDNGIEATLPEAVALRVRAMENYTCTI
jgi:hypothetical protein